MVVVILVNIKKYSPLLFWLVDLEPYLVRITNITLRDFCSSVKLVVIHISVVDFGT
jgi:hypothetical protein